MRNSKVPKLAMRIQPQLANMMIAVMACDTGIHRVRFLLLRLVLKRSRTVGALDLKIQHLPIARPLHSTDLYGSLESRDL